MHRLSLCKPGSGGSYRGHRHATILTSSRPIQYMILCLSHAKNPFPRTVARTRAAAQRAFMVAPAWQSQTISCSCQSLSSKKRLASPYVSSFRPEAHSTGSSKATAIGDPSPRTPARSSRGRYSVPANAARHRSGYCSRSSAQRSIRWFRVIAEYAAEDSILATACS